MKDDNYYWKMKREIFHQLRNHLSSESAYFTFHNLKIYERTSDIDFTSIIWYRKYTQRIVFLQQIFSKFKFQARSESRRWPQEVFYRLYHLKRLKSLLTKSNDTCSPFSNNLQPDNHCNACLCQTINNGREPIFIKFIYEFWHYLISKFIKPKTNES